MAEFRKTILIALQFIIVTGLLSIGYGLIVHRRFTFEYIVIANIIVGTIILCVALLIFMLPVALIHNRLTGKLTGFKYDNLTDHTTYIERRYAEKHLEKQKKAYGFLFLGLSILIITGLLELLVVTLL
jgi:pilus assembly protein TadC